MRSALVAMLWENWRLTRVEAMQRVALGLVAGSAAMLLAERGALIAFWILVTLHGFFYMSIAKLNGGRFIDGYKIRCYRKHSRDDLLAARAEQQPCVR